MADEKNTIQSTQKDFTRKNSYKKNDRKTDFEKLEKADSSFNSVSAGAKKEAKESKEFKEFKEVKEFKPEETKIEEVKVETKTEEVKPEDIKVETKVEEVKPEPKPEFKPAFESKPKSDSNFKRKEAKIFGKVIAVSPLSYSVQTKDGSGYRVVGKHNKKVGDTV